MYDQVKNIIVVGTGGQGVVLASEILCEVAMDCGYDTKKSEIHGMSQRGGIVSSHVRFGKKVASPTVYMGTADIILSFELAEAARWIPFIRKEGRVITSTQRIVPPVVSTGMAIYPDNIEDILKHNSDDPIIVDALSLANKLGNPRLVNTILLGILSNLLSFPDSIWREVVAGRVPLRYRELNMLAFGKGREIVSPFN